MNANIAQLITIKSKKQQINIVLLKKVSITQKYKKQIKTLNRKIEVIKKIRQKQNLPVIYLTELVNKFIRNKLWFNYLSYSSKNKIDIKGVALDNQILAEYIKNLRQSPYIEQIDLKKSSKRQIMGYELITFDFYIKTKKQQTNMP